MSTSQNIVIIGAGIGGLSAACLLASRGHSVTVLERNSGVGGKMNEIVRDGFRFDTGPSLLTMTHIADRLFRECGFDREEHLTFLPLEPICRYQYADGTVFDCYDDEERTLAEISKFAPEDVDAYNRFLNYSEELYRKTADAFIYNPLYDISDLKKLDLLSFFGIDAFTTVSKRVDTYFKSEYLRSFFKRFTTYNGSSPYQAPATLNVIPHVELNMGGYYVDGGMYRIAERLLYMATELGVDIRYGCHVNRIYTNNGRVQGITGSCGRLDADIVVANSDATETISELLDNESVGKARRERARQVEPSCSGFVLMLGIDKTYEQLRHHNIFFSSDYEREFRDIFRYQVFPDDPTIYIANTSYTNPAHAIEGGSNLFVLINAPYLDDNVDNETDLDAYEEHVLDQLEQRGLERLRSHIKVKERITPEDFYTLYLSNKGSIYGTSSNKKTSAFVRPRNKMRKIDGLYFVGGSVHPGGGVPLVMQSAFNAAELIERFE